jgi:hypothetical protein
MHSRVTQPRGASTGPRRPGMPQLGSLSSWVHQFRKHAGKAISKNQLAASSGPAGTAAATALHGFQRPVCIVPPTFQQKVVVQCPSSRLPPHSGSSSLPVLRGTSASTHEQTYGRRPGALCPPARAADLSGRRGSLRRHHANACCGKAARGADAAEHRPGQVGSTSIPNTLGLAVTCVSQNSNPVVAAMCRLGSAFGRERVLVDDGALLSGSYFPRSSSASAGTSVGSSPSSAASSSASRDPRSYSEAQRKI